MKLLKHKWRQLWCQHYWQEVFNELTPYNMDAWCCTHCGKEIWRKWDSPPISFVG